MRNIRRRAAILMAAVISFGGIAGCSQTDISKYLQQQRQSEEIPDHQNQQKAEELKAQRKTVIPPERISLEKYAYQQLDRTEQAVYDEMLSAILKQEVGVQLSTTDTEVMQRAYKAVCSDYGGLFWVDGYVFTRYTRGEELVSLEFSPKYTMAKKERRQLQRQIDGIVEAWLAGISINDSDYDKAKYVYELLALNTEYAEDVANSQNILSVFLLQQTVCQGYACAVQYLFDQLGIESAIVSGTARGEPHAWNLIRLDGDYYYMDATWGNNGYRNKEGKETSFTDYNYMAMTTAEMQMDHQPDSEIKLPQCTAVLNNYYRKEGNYVEEWEPDLIGSKLSDAWENQQVITLRFSDGVLKDQVFRYFVQEGHLADYCSGITQINYIEDSLWQEISFCFNQS
ncbi:MAG: hypothetical protein HFI70_05440 [Lachnospiraceae bacterium]|nr:hypothetical protein [Lachnospiraceae bacterium]